MGVETKSTGIKWIGDIPGDWDMNKIKYISTLKGRIGWQGLTSDEYTDEGAFLITGTDFDNGRINWDTCVHVPIKRWEEAHDIQVENGDLLITKDGTVGKVAIVNGMPDKTSLNSGVLRIATGDGYDRSFLYWVLQSDVFWTWFNYKNAGNSTIIHLYQGDLKEFRYPIPPTEEQVSIAMFLNDRCGRIDTLISEIEKQVDILRQYRKSIFAEVVTKGLDCKVQMQNSGIIWIGDIPEHWKISKVRYLASLCSGATPSKDVDYYWEGDIPWISSMEVKLDVINDTSLHINKDAVQSCSTTIVPIGTLVMVVRSGILQHTLPVALTGVPCSINQDIKAFAFNSKMRPAYFKYFVQGLNDTLLRELQKDKSTVESIDYNLLLSCPVCVPPLAEQDEIIRSLDTKNASINSIILEKEKALETLLQHKKSLIYEYVTGKKRVKEDRVCQ